MEKADRIILLERTTPKIRGVLAEQSTIKYLKIKQFIPTRPHQLPWLEHVWSVDWDLPEGVQHTQRTIPFPAFNLVADRQKRSALHGCTSGCFAYPLMQQGHVIGIRFKSALQNAFYKPSASDLTDTSVDASLVFRSGIISQLEKLASQPPEVRDLEKLLESLRDDATPNSNDARRVHQMVRYIETNQNAFRVADLVQAFDCSERTIQRKFQTYLGMTPKSAIERFRIQSAINLSAENGVAKFAELSLKLGYFDQAHFINAFRRIIGYSPAEYAKRQHFAMAQTEAPSKKTDGQ